MSFISPRLKKAAEMVLKGVPVVDVGTDHAYLPAYLIINGTVPSASAGDIGIKPLKNAAQTLARYGIEDKVRLSVSDGLKNIDIPSKANITVCGMGGTLISQILNDSRDRISRSGIRLILQPMTRSEDVRAWLCENSFGIISEACVRDSGRVYCCIAAEYCGKTHGNSPGFYRFGLINGDNEEERIYINAQIKRVRTRYNAIADSDIRREEISMLESVISYYESRYGK